MKQMNKIISAIVTVAMLLTLFSAAAVTTFAAVSTAPELNLSNSNYGMTAKWNAVPDAYKYIVYFRQHPQNPWSSAETTDTSFLFTENNSPLCSGAKLYVQVKAADENGEGKFSKVKSLTYLRRTQISLLNYSGSVTVRSSFCLDANCYQIAKTKYGVKKYEYFTSESGTFTDKNVVPGETYSYQVRGMYKTENNGTAYGAWSPTKSICTLAQPTVKLSNKSNGIRAEWNKIAGAAAYRVYYKRYGDSDWAHTDTKNTYYPLLGTQSGTLYYIQVQPLAANGIGGGYSKVKSLTFIGMPQVYGEFEDGKLYFWFSEIKGANAYQVALREETEKEYQYTYLLYADEGYTLEVPKGFHFRVQVRALYATKNNGIAYGAWSKTAHVLT